MAHSISSKMIIWANYDSKKAKYKSAADPFPIVKDLRENIKTITDKELQLGLTDAFAMTRDQHTRWTNIAPYSCFYATTEIQAGDKLLAINGLTFVKWFEKNQFISGGGANEFGGQRTALEYLTTIYGKINRLPSEDSINFQFKSYLNPEIIYTVNVPYVSGHDDECWDLGIKLYKSLPSITLPGTPETSLPVSAEQSRDSQESNTAHFSPEGYKLDSLEDLERGTDMDQMFIFKKKSAILMNPTDVTGVTWGIYKSESANMGVIKLDGFSPEDVETKNLAVLKAVMIIRSLLANELKNTKSVMYELRGNSGGNVRFANSMIRLFKSDFEPFGDRYLMNQITHNVFVEGKDPNVDQYAKAWKEDEPNSRYSNVLFSNSVESVNTLGQAYVRPMGVLNNAMCYSSCEVFSGSIQGHDPTLIRASPDDFKKFPFSQELTSGSTTYTNTLTVGFTQVVRTGRYKGQDIENVGIETDIVVRPRWSDLRSYFTTNSQYDRIAASLARIGQKNGQSKLHFVCEPFAIEKPINGFPLEVEAAGIYEFIVFQADGTTVAAKKRRSLVTKKQKFSIPVSTVGSALGNSHITIVGKTAGKQVLKTIRNVRIIPSDENHMKIITPEFTFTGLSDSVGLYQSPTTAPGNGWNNLNGPWMIGNGVKYVSKIDSSIEAFFTAPIGTEINIGIDVTLDTEHGFDFLYLSVKSSGGIEDFLLSSKSRDGTKTFNGVSGRNMVVKGTGLFITKSEKFSVSLKFTSNWFIEFTGATINSFTVSAA
ncbi:hypothetical protein BASA50_002241 [Batrachochytrium salamandrivorans]|uniref:Tail specific protease domain-containing protein n=1 Tax=Batrachochytrium salamandrivorans TaxID=1357716 RepID=A0ABQ8FN45_9FUNG|nr:hypothetical protein BASA50_002241 [Batrachochytrium salamandrivorans]